MFMTRLLPLFLQDEDPYVRKTAALCVAKLFDLNPMIAIDNGLVAILQEMLSDRNPMVKPFQSFCPSILSRTRF
jgi:vesicle coat complex subunit